VHSQLLEPVSEIAQPLPDRFRDLILLHKIEWNPEHDSSVVGTDVPDSKRISLESAAVNSLLRFKQLFGLWPLPHYFTSTIRRDSIPLKFFKE